MEVTKHKDILDYITFSNIEDKQICDEIVTTLSDFLLESFREDKTFAIPYIGTMKRNNVYRELRKRRKEIKLQRESLPKEDYLKWLDDLKTDIRRDIKATDVQKFFFVRAMRTNKAKYEDIYKKLGKEYANMFILAITLMRPVIYEEDND